MLIEIKANANGSHDNQSTIPNPIPDGWAVIPESLETPNFPFGDIEVEEIDGIMTVTKWIAGIIPEPEPIPEPSEEITAIDILNALTGGIE